MARSFSRAISRRFRKGVDRSQEVRTNPDLGIPVVRVLISGLQNGYFDYQQALSFMDEE
jgi:hypothetical protein